MNYLKAAVLDYILSDIAITKGVIEENTAEAKDANDYEMIAMDYKNLGRIVCMHCAVKAGNVADLLSFMTKEEFNVFLEQVWNYNMPKEA
jgi:hypothetical protein